MAGCSLAQYNVRAPAIEGAFECAKQVLEDLGYQIYKVDETDWSLRASTGSGTGGGHYVQENHDLIFVSLRASGGVLMLEVGAGSGYTDQGYYNLQMTHGAGYRRPSEQVRADADTVLARCSEPDN